MADEKVAPAAGSPEAVAAAATAAAAAEAATAAGKTSDKGGAPAGDAAKPDAAAVAAAAAAEAAKAGGTDGAKASKAPDKYTLTLPDGGRLDASDLKTIEDLARKGGLTNEEAQAAVVENDTLLRFQSDRYLAETTADPELGGAHLARTQQLAKQAIDAILPLGDPHRDAFNTFINRGGAGNNIHVVRFLARVGNLMAEDSATGGRSGGGGGVKDEAAVADARYPSTVGLK